MEEFSTYNSISRGKKFITQHDTTRRYIVFKSIYAYFNVRKDHIYLHELIPFDRPRKFFVDLDGKNQNVDECEKQTNIIIELIRSLFAKVYSIILTSKNIIIVDSSGEVEDGYKFSKNIVIDGYYMVDYAEFKCFGEQLYDLYNSHQNDYCNTNSHQNDYCNNSLPNFLDCNFFNRQYVDSYISARLPGCTKTGETRFKRVLGYEDLEIDDQLNKGILTYVADCVKLPKKANIDREYYAEKYKNAKFLSITDSTINNILTDTKHIWENNFQYRSSKKSGEYISISFDRLRPSYCKICNDTHHNDNSLIISYNISTRCILESCRQMRNHSVLVTQPDFTQITQPRLSEVTQSVHKKLELNYDDMFPPDRNIYLIKAEMKMGKTKKCIEYIEKVQPTNVVLVSFRRTFSIEMKAKYKDFALYSEIKEKAISLDVYPKIIIQVESLHRIKIPAKVDLLILDEIESIWSQFSSGNLTDYCGIMSVYRYLLSYSTKIIVMDAHLNSRTHRLLKYVRPTYDDEVHKYVNHYNPSHDYKYIVIPRTVFYCVMLRKVDNEKKIMILTNSIKESNEMYELLINHNPKLKIGLYNSRTKESKKARHFSNVTKYWTQYDCIICTPTVSAGISYEVEYFDCIFGSFNSMSCNVETCRQMLCRVRNIKSKKVYLNIKSRSRESDLYPTDPETIKKYLKTNRNKLLEDAKGQGIEVLNFEYNVKGDLDFYDNFPYQLVAENIAFENRSKNNFRHLFIKYIRKSGCTVIITQNLDFDTETTESMEGKLRCNAESTKNKKINSIHIAPDINSEQYKELKHKIKTSQDITKQDSDSMEKYKIRNVTKLDVLPKNIIDTFTKTGKIRQLNMCKSLLERTREDDISISYHHMSDNVMKNELLRDANTQYKAITNSLFVQIFNMLPLNISINNLFLGTPSFYYSYHNPNDSHQDVITEQYISDYWVIIDEVRNLLYQFLSSYQLKLPPANIDKDEILIYYKIAMMQIYGIRYINGRYYGMENIIFYHNDKYYKDGKEVAFSTNYPIILIKS